MGATLVLGAAAGDTARVSIANSTNYEACVGSDASALEHTTQTACEPVTGASWHKGTAYDYDDSNNTITLAARAGTPGSAPGTPALKTPAVHTPAVGLS